MKTRGTFEQGVVTTDHLMQPVHIADIETERVDTLSWATQLVGDKARRGSGSPDLLVTTVSGHLY